MNRLIQLNAHINILFECKSGNTFKERKTSNSLLHTVLPNWKATLKGFVNGAHICFHDFSCVKVLSMSLIDVLAVRLLTSEWHIYHCFHCYLRRMVLLCHCMRITYITAWAGDLTASNELNQLLRHLLYSEIWMKREKLCLEACTKAFLVPCS